MAKTRDIKINILKIAKLSLVTLILTYGIFFLIYLWTDFFKTEFFFKVSITFMVFFVLIGIFLAMSNYFNEENRLKKDKFVN